MKNKGFFEKFKNSIYNLTEFPKYINEGIGRAFLYGFILSLFIGVISGVVSSVKLNKSITEVVQTLEQDKYKFKIENGILDLEKSPLKIERGSTLVYIDEDKDIGQADELRSLTVHMDAYILILKDGVVINSSMITGTSGISEVKYNSIIGDVAITNKNIVDTLNLSSKFLYVVLIISIIVQTFMMLIMDCVLVAIMLSVTNIIYRLGLKFSQLLSLTIYASTLPAILILIIDILVPTVYFDSIRALGTFLYAFLALRNIRKEISGSI